MLFNHLILFHHFVFCLQSCPASGSFLMRWFFASGGQSTGASAIVLATKEQTSFNFMAAVTVCSDFGAQESKVCHCFHFFPPICHEVMDRMPWSSFFCMLSFQPAFSLSSFTFINRLFSSSSLYAIRMVSFAYLRLLIFLLTILIPACASSSLVFRMMYSAYMLNNHSE